MSASCPRVLLVYPPSRTQLHYSCPMGLLMLGAVLEQAGYQVKLVDANAAAHRLSIEQIVELARQWKPDVIGLTLVTPLVREAYHLAAALQPVDAKLLAGGPHATILPEEPMEHGFDAVLVGEGEPSIVAAIDALCKKRLPESVPGLVFRDAEGQIHRNEPPPLIADLDSLPLPARHLIDPADFGNTPDLHAHIFTSRGCPGRCAYCAGSLFGKKFRFRSADSVVDEMVMLHHNYGTSHFYFVDDAMTMDRARVRQICNRLIDEKHGFTWNMMTRIDSVDEELLDLVSRAGCRQIDFGVESGFPATLKQIHKPHSIEMVRRVIPLTHRYGIRPVAFLIVGFPWEDPAAIDATLSLMQELSPYVVFQPAIASVLVPFPGTEIYERFKDQYDLQQWWLSDDRNYDAPSFETHPLYQVVMNRMGAVLDADFFHYSQAVKNKIHAFFRLMYASNFRRRGFVYRTLAMAALDTSRHLYRLSPRLEHLVFWLPLTLRQRFLSRPAQ